MICSAPSGNGRCRAFASSHSARLHLPLKTANGQHNGKQIGKMAGSGDSYKGEITDPETDKTYSGAGSVSGNSLKMKGCVMAVLCKTQTWTRL